MAKGVNLAARGGTLEPSIEPATIPISSSAREVGGQLIIPAYVGLLVVVLCVEVTAYYRFSNSTQILMRGGATFLNLQFTVMEWLQYIILGAAATTILLSRMEFAVLAKRALVTPVEGSQRTGILVTQVMLAGALVAWCGLNPARFASPESVAAWALVRIALAAGAMATFALALIPLAIWREWYSARPGAFRVGVAAGIVAVPLLRDFIPAMSTIPMVTSAMYNSSIWAAAAMLNALGQKPVINWERHSIAVPGFRVVIAPLCAGIDGIVIITLFLAAYLWFCRASLRFPLALILFPVGAILSWFLNAVRLAALIMIGRHSPAIALGYFHTIAGWAFLNLLGVGIVVSSHTMSVFRADPLDSVPHAGERSSSADMYILPMLVALAIGMLTRPFGSSFNSLYPVTVIATATALLVYRGRIVGLAWNPDWSAAAAGVVVFAIWIAIARWSGTLHNSAMAVALQGLPEWERTGWLLFRVAGAVVTVPIAEELFFRGYLLRKLVSADFESVDPRHFTWLSFLVSSILFGLLHQNWIGGILAGLGFAMVQYRRGRLTDAIVAHSACNALLAGYAIATSSWGLWS